MFLPVIACNFLQSARLLSESIATFTNKCAVGITADREKMRANLHNSLMLVTALNPHIGYDKAAQVAKLAFREGISLREAVMKLGFMTGEEYDAAVQPEKMV